MGYPYPSFLLMCFWGPQNQLLASLSAVSAHQQVSTSTRVAYWGHPISEPFETCLVNYTRQYELGSSGLTRKEKNHQHSSFTFGIFVILDHSHDSTCGNEQQQPEQCELLLVAPMMTCTLPYMAPSDTLIYGP